MTKEEAIRWTLSKELEHPEWVEAMAAVRLELLAKLSFPGMAISQSGILDNYNKLYNPMHGLGGIFHKA